MLVLFEHNGIDFLVKAKPIGRNGYHLGTVVYAAAKDEPPVRLDRLPPAPAPTVVVEAVAEPTKRNETYGKPTGKVLEKARKNPRLSHWDPQAKEFWLWLKERKRRQGFISTLFSDYRKSRGEKDNSDLAFLLAAAGERHDMWKITPNKNNTRFTLTVVD